MKSEAEIAERKRRKRLKLKARLWLSAHADRERAVREAAGLLCAHLDSQALGRDAHTRAGMSLVKAFPELFKGKLVR